MVFEAQQIIPVAQKGIICNDEHISQTDEDVEYEKEICNVKFVAIDEQGENKIDSEKIKNQLIIIFNTINVSIIFSYLKPISFIFNPCRFL